MIVAQTALIISEPSYAQRLGIEPGMPSEALRGAVLFCGPYDPAPLNWDGPHGFMRTVIYRVYLP